MKEFESIGERIKSLRSGKYTQTEFADLIGVSKQTLYKYENGIVTNIPSDKIELIAKYLHVTPAYLMGWESSADDSSSDVPEEADSYYLNEEARDLAEFMHKNPDYKVLFDASRKVKPENLELVKQIIEKFGGTD